MQQHAFYIGAASSALHIHDVIISTHVLPGQALAGTGWQSTPCCTVSQCLQPAQPSTDVSTAREGRGLTLLPANSDTEGRGYVQPGRGLDEV